MLKIDAYPRYLEIIDQHITKNKSARILELGCGHGALLFCLQEKGYKNTVGIDLSQEQVSLAKDIGIENIFCNSIDTYLAENNDKFDAIIMMDVLEHIEKEEILGLLDKVNNNLIEGGSLILHVPNAEGIFGMRIRYGDYTHISCFTSKSIHQVLSVCGFSGVNCYEEPPTVHGLKSLIRNILWKLLVFPYRLLLICETGVVRHLLSQNILVVCKK